MLELAICFSAVVLALAIGYAARLRSDSAESTDRTRYEAATESAKVRADALLEAATIAAEAHVRAARIAAGIVKVKPLPPDDSDRSPYDEWLETDGQRVPENVQGRVDWALGRVLGTEPGDQGTMERAESILATDAPGLLAQTRLWQAARAKRPPS